jgi:hypothetical protein
MLYEASPPIHLDSPSRLDRLHLLSMIYKFIRSIISFIVFSYNFAKATVIYNIMSKYKTPLASENPSLKSCTDPADTGFHIRDNKKYRDN